MSKAKELAREVISMMSDSQGVAGWHMNGDISTWGEWMELENLAHAVLSEPEPDRRIAELDEEIALLKTDLNLHQLELQALRDWKEKASVMLRHEWIILKFNHDMFEDNQPLQDKKKLAILTELLRDK